MLQAGQYCKATQSESKAVVPSVQRVKSDAMGSKGVSDFFVQRGAAKYLPDVGGLIGYASLPCTHYCFHPLHVTDFVGVAGPDLSIAESA